MSALGLAITAVVVLALLSYVGGAKACRELLTRAQRMRAAGRSVSAPRLDPGVERRAEVKARALLQSVVNEEDWEMYRDLGFIRVRGSKARRGTGGYCYLIYPHKPIVAYLPDSNSLLSEYCVEFPERSDQPYGHRLPDSDDVLAKWMMIKADEEQLIRGSNMHLPGRQVDPQQIRRDLARLREWDRTAAARARRREQAQQQTTIREAGATA